VGVPPPPPPPNGLHHPLPVEDHGGDGTVVRHRTAWKIAQTGQSGACIVSPLAGLVGHCSAFAYGILLSSSSFPYALLHSDCGILPL
jgi:dipeptidyl aminopeptidase/acylaminoacyl peptidase